MVGTAEQPVLSPEEQLVRWGVPLGLLGLLGVLVLVISTFETLGKPTRWLWARLRR
jgi:hypothetical protein